MELMLKIKRHGCFKDRGKAVLNCVELGLKRFSFGFGLFIDCILEEK